MEYRYDCHTVFSIEYHLDEMIKTYLDHHFEPKKDDDFRTES